MSVRVPGPSRDQCSTRAGCSPVVCRIAPSHCADEHSLSGVLEAKGLLNWVDTRTVHSGSSRGPADWVHFCTQSAGTPAPRTSHRVTDAPTCGVARVWSGTTSGWWGRTRGSAKAQSTDPRCPDHRNGPGVSQRHVPLHLPPGRVASRTCRGQDALAQRGLCVPSSRPEEAHLVHLVTPARRAPGVWGGVPRGSRERTSTPVLSGLRQ